MLMAVQLDLPVSRFGQLQDMTRRFLSEETASHHNND